MRNLKRSLVSRLARLFDADTADRIYAVFLITMLAFIYYVSAVLSLQVAFQKTNATPVWPPSGIAFTALLVFGYRLWPGIWWGAFLANITVFMSNHVADLSAACFPSFFIGMGNTLEAVLGVFLLNCFTTSRNPLFRIQDIFKFVFVVLIAALPSATIGSTVVGFSQKVPWPVFKVMWSTWWLGDVLSILILAPFLLILSEVRLRVPPVKRMLEAAAFLVVLTVVNIGIFGEGSLFNKHYFPTVYLILPLMVWATYRFGYWGATATALVTLIYGIEGTIYGHGPFFGPDLNISLLLMQVFTWIMTITGLVLAAALYERRQAEEQLRHNSQRFQALVENSQDMIVLLDRNAVVSYASPSVTTVLGYPVEEYLGHNILEFIHLQDRDYIIRRLSEVLAGPGTIVHGQCRSYHKEGAWRWIEGTAHNLLEEPAVNAIVVNYHDITERKMAEEVLKRDKESLERMVDERSKELLNTQRELKQSSRLADIGTLAATVAHELRNPLGVIQMAAYNLKRKQASLLDDKHLGNIEKKVWEGNQIIDNLLTYSRIKIPLYERINLFNVLDECVNTAQARFHDHNIAIVKKYDTGRHDHIEADQQQIKEIFTNILNNACQAFPGKSGTIELTVQYEGEQVKVMCRDNGMGIEEADLHKIFIPFFTRKSKGTGLGLTICNELVNLHHGKIEIQSRKGEGTTVSVTLPLKGAGDEQKTAHH